ncbi:transposase [Agrobacterium sp. LAD9]|uniref:transposase n=1 Tax=Agrobacterium sp. LAD9 TaxID=2055153 RepID=UPI000D1F0EFD|nr:transposase [Agrobacterium sp. LAD9]
MADEEMPALPEGDATKPAAEQAATAVKSKRPSSKTTTAVKSGAASVKVARQKARGLSEAEKLEKISQVEAAVAAGATLKTAVLAASISDQTYYMWKKAAAAAPAEDRLSASSPDDEFAEFIHLEEENRRLRKLLADKLRSENADLRRRLGMN